MFYIFLTCGSAVILTIVIFHQDYFMTKTLNFGVFFLFKGEILRRDALLVPAFLIGGGPAPAALSVRPTAHRVMLGRSLYFFFFLIQIQFNTTLWLCLVLAGLPVVASLNSTGLFYSNKQKMEK